MPSTDRKLELNAKTSVAQTGSQPYVYAKGLTVKKYDTVILMIILEVTLIIFIRQHLTGS
jgi:hypothetical protein